MHSLFFSFWIQILLLLSVTTSSRFSLGLFQGLKKPTKVIQRVIGVENRSIELNCYDTLDAANASQYVMWFYKRCGGSGANTSCETLIKDGWADELICGFNRHPCSPNLQIKKLTTSLSGIYSCYKYRRILKFTIRGERMKSYVLNVASVPYDPPVFVNNGPFNRTVRPHEAVESTCKVYSALPVKFYWLKLIQAVEYENIQDEFDNYIFEALNATTTTKLGDNLYSSTLKFPFVSMHDTGTYGCVASNDMGTIYRHFNLDVQKCKVGLCSYPNYEHFSMSLYLIILIMFCIFLNLFLLCLLKKFLNRVENKL